MSRKQQKARAVTKAPLVSQLEWQALPHNQRLSADYQHLATEIQNAQSKAEQLAQRTGRPADSHLDLTRAIAIIDRNPELLRYVQTIAQEGQGVPFTFGGAPDYTRGAPSGVLSPQAANVSGRGGWSGSYTPPDGVVNARILRDWADTNEWVRAAINVRRQQIGRANIAVMPFNERKSYSKVLAKRVQLLLDQPNEYRQNYYELMAGCMDDLLVLDRAVILKDMTPDRKPVHIYNEDGACIKIYPNWSGRPNEPRYLYESTFSDRKVPLRNDEAIVMISNPATYRYGLSPVQVLRNTIQADLSATRSAMAMVDGKTPPHMIQLPGATQQQLEQIRIAYENNIAGRKEIFWVGGQTQAMVENLVFSAKDNQWLEWQVYLARKIAITFQISPQQLGITFDINKATASSQQEIFEDTGLIPLLLLIEEYFNRELLGDFAVSMPDDRANFELLNLRILFPEVTEADRQMHAERAISIATDGLAGLPSMTLNQVLAMFGQEPVDGGNTFYANTTVGPVAWLSYDNITGDFGNTGTVGGAQGAQDALGGPDAIDDDAPRDASSDTDYTGPPQTTPPPASPKPSASSGKTPPKKQLDTRQFGKRWISSYISQGED